MLITINRLISASNHMFGRANWDKLPECIFENFEIARVKQGQFPVFQNHEGDLSQKSPSQTYDYRLITVNQKTLCIFNSG